MMMLPRLFQRAINKLRHNSSSSNRTSSVRKSKEGSNISIIGGSNGPTSIFVAKRDPALHQKREEQFRLKCEKLEPNAHSFEEVVDYIIHKYDAKKVTADQRSYQMEYHDLKAMLVLRERPDLVATPMPDDPKRNQMSNQIFMDRYFQQIEQRNEEAYQVAEDIFPIDLEQYKILIQQGQAEGMITVNLEYEFELLSISYQGCPCSENRDMNPCDKIMKDIYRYYGVREEDIEERNERCRTYVRMVGL